jgi:hypothetical protein
MAERRAITRELQSRYRRASNGGEWPNARGALHIDRMGSGARDLRERRPRDSSSRRHALTMASLAACFEARTQAASICPNNLDLHWARLLCVLAVTS